MIEYIVVADTRLEIGFLYKYIHLLYIVGLAKPYDVYISLLISTKYRNEIMIYG